MPLNHKSVHIVVGARPNYMKVKVLLGLLPNCTLIHTGQHFAEKMSTAFFAQLGIKAPDRVLEPLRQSQIAMIASTMQQLEAYWRENSPRLVIVVGDVNSTMAAALTASRLNLKIAHIEAGLRSRDLSMPEEINRILADACSNYLFCSEQAGVENLAAESRTDHVYLVGNTMIDCLIALQPLIDGRSILAALNLSPVDYAVLTLHRPSNVDNGEKLQHILGFLDKTGHKFIYPVHPRISMDKTFKNIRIVQPLLYLDFIKLVKESTFVFTDSGGLQEETTYLGIPCLTFRPTTERPSTIQLGTNELLQNLEDFEKILDYTLTKTSSIPPFWDGKASARIIKILNEAM
ncbi:MAG: UDP-N-acetylglucosamine 2-epimerase (non-hydrolyzing) [Chloroflexi bacterium]|nr:UDP-N-acetylglucosamine 2-epimerase (non-hydrolyzing) [Chloroflexota bacterium]